MSEAGLLQNRLFRPNFRARFCHLFARFPHSCPAFHILLPLIEINGDKSTEKCEHRVKKCRKRDAECQKRAVYSRGGHKMSLSRTQKKAKIVDSVASPPLKWTF